MSGRVYDEDEDVEVSYTGTGQRLAHHHQRLCEGQACAIHRPSNHHMTMWKLHFRSDRPPLMERICRHGVGHPDPDALAWLNTQPNFKTHAWGVHGCDGCCVGTDEHYVNS